MKTFLAFLAILFSVLIIGTAAGWWSLWTSRPMAQYQQETSRLTESNSRNRIDGVNAGIASLCLNMRTEADGPTKQAFASMIASEAASFQRPELLTPSNAACWVEAERLTAPVG